MRRVAVEGRDSLVDVDAFDTATPGLVVHRTLIDEVDGDDETWTVSHERSGLMIAIVDGSEWAQMLAAELGPLTDWTQSGHAIAGSPAEPIIKATISGFNGDFRGDARRPRAVEARRR